MQASALPRDAAGDQVSPKYYVVKKIAVMYFVVILNLHCSGFIVVQSVHRQDVPLKARCMFVNVTFFQPIHFPHAAGLRNTRRAPCGFPLAQATACLHLITIRQPDVFRRSNRRRPFEKKNNCPVENWGGDRIHYTNSGVCFPKVTKSFFDEF
jgi:hypothetical protein